MQHVKKVDITYLAFVKVYGDNSMPELYLCST
jgi:hypothetical protein